MTLKVETTVGFQGSAFEAGNARLRSEQHIKADTAAVKSPASETKLARTSPQQVTNVSEKRVDLFPKLVGPDAPANLLFEASVAASAGQRHQPRKPWRPYPIAPLDK